MPLRRSNTRWFHRTLFAGEMEKIRLLKRKDNQQQGTVTAHIIFNCRIGIITKTAETIQGEMSARHFAIWHIPAAELLRRGIKYINPLDRIERIVGPYAGEIWQPEGTTNIDVKLFGNHIDLACLRVDNPRTS